MSPEQPSMQLFDDQTLDGEVSLLRRINPGPLARSVDWASVDNAGRPQIKSGAFQRASKKVSTSHGYPERTLSFFVESVVVEEFGSVEAWWSATNPEGTDWGVARVLAAEFRRFGFGLQRDDLDGYVGHGVAWAMESGKRADAAQVPLANASVWVIAPARPRD